MECVGEGLNNTNKLVNASKHFRLGNWTEIVCPFYVPRTTNQITPNSHWLVNYLGVLSGVKIRVKVSLNVPYKCVAVKIHAFAAPKIRGPIQQFHGYLRLSAG